MKLIAHATVPSKPSYSHVGYTAAAPVNAAGGFPGPGILVLIAGLLMALRMRRGRTGWTEVLFLPRRPLGWFLAGLACMVVGLVWIASSLTP